MGANRFRTKPPLQLLDIIILVGNNRDVRVTEWHHVQTDILVRQVP